MFSKFINTRNILLRSFLFCDTNHLVFNARSLQNRSYFGGLYTVKSRLCKTKSAIQSIHRPQFKQHFRRHSSTSDSDSTIIQDNDSSNDQDTITRLFPQPRVTMNELSDRTPQKIFEVHYRQVTVSPKGGKKKKVNVNNDWMCTYSLIWPEKIKFESTAISKRQAAEKAATQALSWLYNNNRINKNGDPIYDRDKIDTIKDSLNVPLFASLSCESIEQIEDLWKEYEGNIRDVYIETHQSALRRTALKPVGVYKESSLDDDGDDESSKSLQGYNSVLDDLLDSKEQVHPVYGKIITQPSQSSIIRRQMELKKTMERFKENITELPIDAYTEEIRSTVNSNRVTVLVGAAGCGKSTRAPVAILDSDIPVCAVVAEPRKVAAIGICERVANELGEEIATTVGYQVRLASKPPRPPCGSILYCTSGVLLRRLQSNPGLFGCTHVFIDEAHERDVNTDIILLLLKRALTLNDELKIIIMSATLNIDVFTRYFDKCPVIEIPGRTFPVNVTYLEELQSRYPTLDITQTKEHCNDESRPFIVSNEIVGIIKAIDTNESEGAILVFLPGWAEIKHVKSLLKQELKHSVRHLVLPVHSSLSTEDQTKIFAQPPPGVRKIVLATNIAETSITIPDVVYVVDCGAQKEKRIREGSGTATLQTVWISRSSGQQRAGRAGRVREGHCYRIYTREKEREFREHNTPEILRVPLEQIALECKSYAPNDKVEEFLSQLPEPPSAKAVNYAVNDLINLGALNPKEELTPFGVYLSQFSLHPRLAAYLLHSGLTGTFGYGLNLTAHLADNMVIFNQTGDDKEEIRSTLQRYSRTSDHSALHRIQDEFEQQLQQLGWNDVDTWCDKYKLRKNRMAYAKALSKLHYDELIKSNFVTDHELNDLYTFTDVDELGVATLLSGSDSLLVTKRRLKTKGKLAMVKQAYTSKGDRAHIGSESVNYKLTSSCNSPVSDLLVYFGGYHSLDRRALVLHNTSLVSAHTALVFGQGDLDIVQNNEDENLVSLHLRRHHKLDIKMPKNEAKTVLKLREMLWSTFKYYYERDTRINNKDQNETIAYFKTRLIRTIVKVLMEGRKDIVDVTDESVNLFGK